MCGTLSSPLPTMEFNSLAADPSKLSYFSLPGEIRNKIMDYVLVPGDIYPCRPAQTTSTGSSDTMAKAESHPGIQLIATCRQAYHEGHNLFYSSNTFHLPPTMTFEWPDRLQPKHKAMIKRISTPIGLDELTPEMLHKIESSVPAGVDQKSGDHWASASASALIDAWSSKFTYIAAWNSLEEIELRSFGHTKVLQYHEIVANMAQPWLWDGDFWYKLLRRHHLCVVGNIYVMTDSVGWDRTKEWLCARKPDEIAEGFWVPAE